MRQILLLTVTLFATAAGAAEPISALVEERARGHYGNTVPPDAQITVMTTAGTLNEAIGLSAFWIDPKSGKFLANAVSTTGIEHRISGYAVITMKVAVPIRKLFPGEILAKTDLKVIDVPHIRVTSFAVTDLDRLVGKEVKSLLSPGRQIMIQAIREPLAIRRGDNVSIHFVGNRLELSAPGRALGDAHDGEELKVVNTLSNKTVLGVARPNGRVEIVR
ncbi:flagellar basal body P-ring formation chaperone FlgA [Roseivivax sp. CAU 1753]